MTRKFAARRAGSSARGLRPLAPDAVLRAWHLLGLLAALPFVVFGAEALGLRVFYHHDLQYYFFPYHKLVRDIAAQGALPLWNPYAFSGIPLLGDGQTAMFYPPNWLFWLLPPAHALTVVVLLQFSIAGVGAFLYARALGLRPAAALVAALAYMFNGFLVVRVVHLSIMAGAALVPWVFWAVERVLQRATAQQLALAAGAVCVQALTGHPQVPIYTAVAVGLYVLVYCVQHRQRGIRALLPLGWLGGVYVLGYALAAVQLAPWIEFASFSPRAAGASYEFVASQSLNRFDWLLFLFPYGYGGPTRNWMQTTPAWDLPVYLWERLAYVGVLPLGLALVGVADLRRSRRVDAQANGLQRQRLIALLVVLIVMLLITAGSSTPFGRLVYALPAIGKLRAYARAIAVVCFVVTVLAAFGVERLARIRAGRGLDRAAVIAGAVLVLVVDAVLMIANTVGAQGFPSAEQQPMYKVMLDRSLQLGQANAYMPLILALLSASMLLWLSFGLTRLKTAAVIGLIAFDLLSFAATFNPTTDPQVFVQVPDSVEFLRRDPDLFRTASFVREDKLMPGEAQAQLAISWAIPYGIEDINGFNSLQPRRYTDFLFGPQIEDVSYGFLNDPQLLAPENNLLSMLNVKYALVQAQSDVVPPQPAPGMLIAPEDAPQTWQRVFGDQYVTIYRNPNPLPRAYFVDRVNVLPDARAILELIKLPTFDPARQALVEGGLSLQAAAQISPLADATEPATVRVERVSPNELLLHTSTSADRFLVLSEMWFPGWRAELNGQNLPIFRTNYLFRGVIVPAGDHTIRMVYRPASALVGVAITGATGVALVAALVARRRRARRAA